MKKILITWWAWFIGSNLCRRLLNEWNEIICLDNLFTGSKENIVDLLDNPRFSFVFHDINTPLKWQFDEIYNLACPASPPFYQKNPIETMKTSVIGSINMLDLALSTKSKILQASTSEVYWDPEINPQVESYWGNVNPIWIRSCYDEWKRTAETLFMDYYREHNVDIRIIRIFNTYGPWMNPEDWRVVSNFIMQALRNEDITIYWDWNQTRSFQYVDDLVEVIIRMMNNDIGFVWPVNTGTDFEFTMNELASIILKLIPNSKSSIVYKKLPWDDPKQRKADNSLAKKKLNREPKIKLEEGLKKSIEYFKNFI